MRLGKKDSETYPRKQTCPRLGICFQEQDKGAVENVVTRLYLNLRFLEARASPQDPGRGSDRPRRRGHETSPALVRQR